MTTNNEATVCSITHCYVDWASYCFSAQWYSQICAGQRWDQGWSEEVEVRKSGGKNESYIEKSSFSSRSKSFLSSAGKTASGSGCSEITGDGCFQYLPLQKEIYQRWGKISLRSNNELSINLWAKNMLWSVRAHSSCWDLSFITQIAAVQPCPCYCSLSPCWLNKLLLDVWGPTPAINLFTFN